MDAEIALIAGSVLFLAHAFEQLPGIKLTP